MRLFIEHGRPFKGWAAVQITEMDDFTTAMRNWISAHDGWVNITGGGFDPTVWFEDEDDRAMFLLAFSDQLT